MAGSAAGRVSLADLLRLLAVADRGELILDNDGETWFGYVRGESPHAFQPEVAFPSLPLPPSVRSAAKPTRRSKSLQMPFVTGIVERETTQPVVNDMQRHREIAPLTPADTESRTQGVPQVGFEDLVPKARLLPVLRRVLAATRTGGFDVARLVKSLADCNLPRQLPRQRWLRWHPELVVVLDFSDRLWPYREDMHRLAEQLLQLCGRSMVSLRILNHGPSGPWHDWLAEQTLSTSGIQRTWRMPISGTPVLIVSDLGQLLPSSAPERGSWQAFIEKLRHARAQPLVLAPLGAEQLDGLLPRLLPVLRWSPDARLLPASGCGSPTPKPEGLNALLAMVAATRRVDPPLLRAMRRLNPSGPLNAGLEGALWCHEHVDAGTAACIRRSYQQRHLERFSNELGSLHLALHRLRMKHHAHLRRALEHEEVLLWATYAHAATVEAAAGEIKAAEQFLRRLPETIERGATTPEEKQRWRQVAHAIVSRAEVSAEMLAKYGDVLQPLKEVAASDRNKRHLVSQCLIVCDVLNGQIRVQERLMGPQQYALSSALTLDNRGLIVRCFEAKSTPRAVQLVSRGELPVVIGNINTRQIVELRTSHDLIKLGPILRPRGIQRWWCGKRGIEFELPSFCGIGVQKGELRSEWPTHNVSQWLWAKGPHHESSPLEPVLDRDRRQVGWHLVSRDQHPLDRPKAGHPFFGFDEFGLYADLLIETFRGRAMQRFRHIEPGVFLMGSPDNEPQREGREGPEHSVKLTQGFWLADTVCTQALWTAVMGSNPSDFKGEQLPVESVSWHNVQEFLRTLNQLLPKFHADLPTEAEWEYACRAGTSDPFSFGENITSAHVNYDGNYPYAGAATGEYREHTVPVKSLPVNPWGLYEMHGNVWEWCADGLREYSKTAVTDPVGTLEDDSAARVLRGGSWYGGGWWARSASRRARVPGYRYVDFGFRVCSRSSEFVPALTRPGQGQSARGSRSGASPEPPNGARPE
jgi:formylglycine-generating enzyme required for sulfatase activity